MSTGATKPCPFCGESIQAAAVKCRFCGEFVEDAEPLLVRRDGPPDEGAVQFLVPVNVSGWSIVALYAGGIGLCLPIVGLIFAIPAFICGIVAVTRLKKASSYGAVSGNIRAILGLIFSILAILLWGGFLLVMLLGYLQVI